MRSEQDQNRRNKQIIIIATIGILLLILIALTAWRIVGYVKTTIADTSSEAAAEAYLEGRSDATADAQEAEESNLIEEGFLPLEDCMTASGFEVTTGSESSYVKTKDGIRILICFDLEAESATKNEFTFDLSGSFYELRGVTYVKADALTAVTNDLYEQTADGITAVNVATTYDYDGHEWTDGRLIAHAGGGYRDSEGGYFSYYTNSYEAMVQNYNLGNRIFEFDFDLTTDNRLAAVHDWKDFANKDGEAVSSEEWSHLTATAKPETEGEYTTIFLEDILDQMVVNSDMYLVTDVKYDNMTEEEISDEFTLIYEAAMERDPDLINRIIPQIYSEEMYDWIMSIYDWPCLIFTCYKTDAGADEIISFCASKDNIPVITAKYQDTRFDEAAIAALHADGLLIYNYTISTNTKMYDCLANGIDGIYSNNMLPQDIKTYLSCLPQE